MRELRLGEGSSNQSSDHEADGAAQIPLDLPNQPVRMQRDNLVITDANAGDLATLDAWVASDDLGLSICGAPAAGKTHLAAIINNALNARRVQMPASGAFPAHDAGSDPLIIDDLNHLTDPTALLEFLGQARQAGRRIVLVGRGMPIDWAHGLRDLETRLEAMTRICVSAPDETLLRDVMMKMFEDMQRKLDPKVAAYVTPRINRSLEAVSTFVRAAEDRARREKSPITLPLARKTLATMGLL